MVCMALQPIFLMLTITCNAFHIASFSSRKACMRWSVGANILRAHVSTSPSTSDAAAESTPVSIIANTIKIPKQFRPYPFQYHEILTLEVETLTNMGVGICRIEVQPPPENPPATQEENKGRKRGRRSKRNNNSKNASGDTSKLEYVIEEDTAEVLDKATDNEVKPVRKWVIFVPGTIPGETIEARIFRNHKSYSDADLVSIVKPSLKHERIETVCPLASTECGGCQYQHMTIESQRNWKQQHVQELFERIADFDPDSFPAVMETVGTEHIYGYRSKLTPHYQRPNKDTGLIKDIGFQKKNARVLVDVPRCEIATPAINGKLAEVRQEIFDAAESGTLKKTNKGATLLFRDANEGVVTDNNQYVTTEVDDLTFRFLAGNFFQNNPYMLPVMTKHVVDVATENSDDGTEMTHLIDCYCGSGLFCLSSAKYFQLCAGIEINEKAIEEASANAELNSVNNCAFVAASAEAIFDSKNKVKLSNDDEGVLVDDFPRESTVVIVDPPRKGCSEEFLDQLYKYSPQRVVYMSCDPATQARDAKGIVANGYDLVSTQPFDLFPQTRHIECLCVFEKREK